MNVGHADLMHVAATFLRTHPEYVDDLSAWSAWALPRGLDAARSRHLGSTSSARPPVRAARGCGRGGVPAANGWASSEPNPPG
ncbi:hypothetical protein CS0771_02410 [Catellatospora sp. IY07-71]|nr:hypothetical protein CS0771_02410 [Catellatospora sp. IY07-71]